MTRLVDLVPEYQRHLRSLGNRPRGIDRYLQHLRLFLHSLGPGATVADLDARAVKAHLRERSETCEPATVLGMLTAVRSFCKFLIEEELLDIDPTTRVRWPKRTDRLPKALSDTELAHLLQAIREPAQLSPRERWYWRRNRRAIYLMLYAGLRLSETAALLWRDVDMRQRTLIVRDGKGGKQRIIPVHDVLYAELLPASAAPPHYSVAGSWDGGAISGKVLAQVFERWLPRRGVEGVHAHRLRHTFATGMLRSGAQLVDIQEAMGHANLDTTKNYLQIDFSRTKAAISLLPDWDKALQSRPNDPL